MNNDDFARFLANSGAARFGSFKLKSGATSNVFFDFGNIRSGNHLLCLGAGFAHFLFNSQLYRTGALFGPAYKGIAIATATSMMLAKDYGLDVPISYNRKTTKSHGEGGRFIGTDLNTVEDIVILDDVFTDGGTKYEVLEMISVFPHLKVKAVVVGVDREETEATSGELHRVRFERATGIRVFSLTTKSAVLASQHA